MKRILIPTDFSDNAWNALVYALRLLQNEACTFYLLNSYELHPANLGSTGYLTRTGKLLQVLKENSVRELNKLKEQAESSGNNDNHVFEIVATNLPLNQAVDSYSKEHDIDFVFMGTKGATGAKKIFLGSNTKRTITKIKNCPIIAIPEDAYFEGIAEIAFATSLREPYHKKEIKSLVHLAQIMDAMVRIIHVLDDGELSSLESNNLNALEHQLSDIEYCVHTIREFKNIEKSIGTVIAELELEFLAMISYKHNFIENLWREPVIKKMALHTKIPFLVIPQSR